LISQEYHKTNVAAD